ncbi:radical SAM protein [Vibrio parahaemolyticus]|nr:radical SAM protein [Vibrio parahaemolyticus]ELA7500307.1 radical SAM protein [Vibrio parahaemolyticus]ELA7675172.1 radical SAM protein [Vibrio parahaemolyticus]
MSNLIKSSDLAFIASDKILELIIFPTEKCNLRCNYCYEKFELGRMPPAIIKGVKSLIEKRMTSLEHLSISWFGGEPLVAKDIIYEISSFSSNLSLTHNVSFNSSITTNGYLLDIDTVKKFASNGIRAYQITLDGDKDYHDSIRKFHNGKGTFDVIWKNLCDIRDSELNLHIVLRLHYSPANFGKYPDFIRKLENEFGDDERFVFDYQAVQKWGGKYDDSLSTYKFDDRELIKTLLSSKSAKYNLRKPKHQICYAARANSFIIRSNGRVGKCTVSLYDDRNDVGTITEKGELIIEQSKIIPWIRGLKSMNPNDLACPMSGMDNVSIQKKDIIYKSRNL